MKYHGELTYRFDPMDGGVPESLKAHVRKEIEPLYHIADMRTFFDQFSGDWRVTFYLLETKQ